MNHILLDLHCDLPDIQDVRIRLNGHEYTLTPVASSAADAPTGPTFGQYADEQIDLLRQGKHIRTSETYYCAKKRFLNYLGHDIALSQIDSRLIQDYEQYLKADGLISNSTAFHMRIIRAVYNKAVKQHLITDVRPFTDVYTNIKDFSLMTMPTALLLS